MSRKIFIYLITVMAASLAPALVFCAVYQSGFRTIGIWIEEPPLRMDLNIWYPTTRAENNLNILPWVFKSALNAKPAEGKFPLLLLSHATPATRFSYHYLATWLARHGYCVAAPTHTRDSMNNMDDLFTWNQLARRAKEISAVLDVILTEKDISPYIDPKRIGFIGFGSGGAAGLMLGGARPNCDQWPGYCASAGPEDPYCSNWAKEKMNDICEHITESDNFVDDRIKAFAVISPAYGMLFSELSFSSFRKHILLVAAGRDSFNRPDRHSEPLARILGDNARYIDLPDADAGSLMAHCPPSLEADLPELCLSMSAEAKAALHHILEEALLMFFNKYL